MDSILESDSIDSLWEITKSHAGIEFSKLKEYFKNSSKCYAIVLKNFQPFTASLSDYGLNVAPQNFSYVHK